MSPVSTHWREIDFCFLIRGTALQLPEEVRHQLQSALTVLAEDAWPYRSTGVTVVTLDHSRDLFAVFERHPTFPGVSAWLLFWADRRARRLTVLGVAVRHETEAEAAANVLPPERDTLTARILRDLIITGEIQRPPDSDDRWPFDQTIGPT